LPTRLAPLFFLISYGLLEVAVTLHAAKEHDTHIPSLLLFVAVAVSLAGVSLLVRRRPAGPSSPSPGEPRFDAPLLLFVLVFLAGLVTQLGAGIDIADRSPQLRRLATVGFYTAAAASLAYLWWCLPASVTARRRFQPPTLALALFLMGLATAIKIAAIVYEVRPGIDVYAVLQDGAKALLSGLDPYATPSADALRMGAQFGNAAPAYVYPPANLFLTTVAIKLSGDVRYLYIFSDLLAAVLLLALGRGAAVNGTRVRRYAELAALLVVFHPRSFGKTWTEPLMLPMIFGLALLATRRASMVAQAALAGLLLSMKQYLVFLAPLVALHLRRPRYLAVLVAATAITSVPFLLWHAGAYWDAMTAHSKSPFRADSITLASFLHHELKLSSPAWLGLALASVATALACWLAPRRGLYGLLAWGGTIYLLLFFGSSYAFPNYYHFVMGLLLAATVVGLSGFDAPIVPVPVRATSEPAPAPRAATLEG